MTSQERHIVVIGGGIIGCSAAYFLTRHPSYDPSRHKITILEATEIAGGASGKAGGLLALWAFPSSIVPLSYRLHAELAREHNGKERWGYREVNCGQLAAQGRPWTVNKPGDNNSAEAPQDPGAAVSLQKRGEEAMKELKSAGFPRDLDWFDAEALKSYEEMSGSGETAQVHPYLFTTSMAQLAEDKGARVVLGQVTNIKHSKDAVQSVTYTEKETGASHSIPATDVVIAAGPWTRNIFPRAPISALRAHSVVVRPTRPVSAYTLFTELALPAGFGSLSGAGKGKVRPRVVSPEIYARPDDTVYACGEGDTLVPLPDTTADVEVDPARCQDIIDSIGSVSKALREGDVITRQACYLPNVEIARAGPLIGHVGIKGLFMATGHTCWGIQNAPGTGKLISEFVFEGEAKSASIARLDPRKFV
ncbi:hypothetical protein RJZ56_006018 [Blastomyces dermatitidis]|uniref:FAD dependent oxidoreductase n=2 Tax=Ajellomyces dermatitidis TaxID=5039 RepID=F2TME0_AJEDA|nr:uncharacterized protein BDCG_06709 [Blastomyces dermatitidis ER-3]EEQ91589.1 hypothetical protein BDCG_06709 [Blastomyces dermatitidis ER-3]EGE84403.1 FAD dependent oxidoreductase [Blastomyces dermatitidis ATCC 18188]